MRMKPYWTTLFPMVLFSGSCAQQDHGLKSQVLESTSHLPSIQVDETIFETGTLAIADASGPQYIAKAIPYAPVKRVKEQLDTQFGTTFLARPEAHVTLITPPEYQVLTKVIKRENILALADQMGVQKSSFQIPCLGKGTKVERNQTLATYYLVVQDDGLLSFRRALAEQFLAQGGKTGQFNPSQYYPHITVAFTKRDLHFEDGVIKDQKSCVFEVETHD